MENFENNQFPQEPEIQENQEQTMQEQYRPEPEHQTYRGAGVGRKESPFANSPYEMEHEPPRYAPWEEKPKKPKKKKKKSGFG